MISCRGEGGGEIKMIEMHNIYTPGDKCILKIWVKIRGVEHRGRPCKMKLWTLPSLPGISNGQLKMKKVNRKLLYKIANLKQKLV